MEDIKTYGAIIAGWLSFDIDGVTGTYFKIASSIFITIQVIQAIRKWNIHKK